MGGANLGKGLNDMVNLKRNPNQIMNKLQSAIDPKMMSQLGGAGNLMNMMKEMSNNPQMEEMMKQFGGADMGAALGALGGGGGGGKKKVVKVKAKR